MRTKEGAVLLVGSELATETSLRLGLHARGFDTEVASRGDDGLALALVRRFALVVSDLKMAGISGLELLAQLRQAQPNLRVILTTDCATADTAIEAAKLGAYACLVKPFVIPEFLELVSKAATSKRTAPESKGPVETKLNSRGLLGFSPPMQKLYQDIGRAAATPWGVLIRGGTGTGKELVACAIHQHSDRRTQPFVAVNCCAIPEPLFESELFGHEVGAFTGARARRTGCFEQAHKGTLFLDEIGDLSSAMQVKLLRALQEKQIRRIGSYKEIAVDVRVVAATNRNLERRMETKEFRPDLFHRLGVFTITTPELREHAQDIRMLADHFLQRVTAEIDRGPSSLQNEAAQFLEVQAWPGNVRQLENVIRRAALMANSEPISLARIRDAYGQPLSVVVAPDLNGAHYLELLQKARSGKMRNVLKIVIKDAESSLIKETISFTHGNQAQAAGLLGVGRTTLREKLVQLGLLPYNGNSHSDACSIRNERPQTGFNLQL